MTKTRSKRPYLIRAMHEWMSDNGHTPHIVVDATLDGVSVPTEHVKNGKIILNISDSAAHNLHMGNENVSFRARFSGVPFDVVVPMRSVPGVYARETGQGMIFSHDAENSEPVAESASAPPAHEPRQRPHLKIVK